MFLPPQLQIYKSHSVMIVRSKHKTYNNIMSKCTYQYLCHLLQYPTKPTQKCQLMFCPPNKSRFFLVKCCKLLNQILDQDKSTSQCIYVFIMESTFYQASCQFMDIHCHEIFITREPQNTHQVSYLSVAVLHNISGLSLLLFQ